MGGPGSFIAEVGLHEIPGTNGALGSPTPCATATQRPWAYLDTTPGPVGKEIRERSEHEKHTLDREDFWFTLSAHLAPQRTPEALMSPTGDTLAKLRPEARKLGYRFANVTLEQGAYVSYQRVVISSVPAANLARAQAGTDRRYGVTASGLRGSRHTVYLDRAAARCSCWPRRDQAAVSGAVSAAV